MAFKIKRQKSRIDWKNKFPKKRIIVLYKKTKGRKPARQEIDFIREAGYFDAMEW